jgi:DTW domain-containing protein YfiP
LLGLWLCGTRLVVRGAAPELVAPSTPLVRCGPGSALLFPDESISSAARVPPPRSATPGSQPQAPLPAGVQHLIVPDGTWAQARRIVRRELLPLGPPRVALAPAWPSAYRLRRKAQGLCTFEAVAVTLALHGAVDVATELLTRFMLWSERQAHIKRGGSLVMPCAPHAAHPALAALAELSPRNRGTAQPAEA